jgi:hypothetical protein
MLLGNCKEKMNQSAGWLPLLQMLCCLPTLLVTAVMPSFFVNQLNKSDNSLR